MLTGFDHWNIIVSNYVCTHHMKPLALLELKELIQAGGRGMYSQSEVAALCHCAFCQFAAI